MTTKQLPLSEQMPPVFNYKEVKGVPRGVHIDRIQKAKPNEYGVLRLVKAALLPTPEQHHQVNVIQKVDEIYIDVPGIFIVFGFPAGGGNDLSYLAPEDDYWLDNPMTVYNGNTDTTPYALHTTQQGGETIWAQFLQIHPITGRKVRYIPSDIAHGCKSLPTQWNQHTGIELIFELVINPGVTMQLPE